MLLRLLAEGFGSRGGGLGWCGDAGSAASGARGCSSSPLAVRAASGGGVGRRSRRVAWCPWLRVRSGGRLPPPSFVFSPPDVDRGGRWSPDPWKVGTPEVRDRSERNLWLACRSRRRRRLLAPFPFSEAPSRFDPHSLPSHTRVKTLASSWLGGSGAACVVTLLKVPSWASWGCARALRGGFLASSDMAVGGSAGL